MTAILLATLRATLAALEQDHAQLGEQIAQFRGVIAYYEAVPPSAPAPRKQLRNTAWRILTEAGGPLHYRAIYQQLCARGVAVTGQDPARNLRAHLSSDPRFVSLGRGLWGLRRRLA